MWGVPHPCRLRGRSRDRLSSLPPRDLDGDARALAGTALDLELPADRARALAHARQAEAQLRGALGPLLHAAAVVRDGEQPVAGLAGERDADVARPRVAHGIAHGLLRDAQQLVVMLRRKTRLQLLALERAGDEARHVRPLGELTERVRKPAAARLAGPQRHHGAARLRQPF